MTLWLDAMGASLRYYDAAGVRTRCLEAGDGEAVIFLHGMGGHVEAYIKNIVPLSDTYRAIAVDMLGHGLTDKPMGNYLIPDYVKHLIALLDVMKIERAHFVGESLGGWVSFGLAEDHPDRVISYTSLVGAGIKVDDFELLRSDGVQELRKRSSQAASAPTRDSIRKRLEWLFHEPAKFVTDELVETRLHFWSNPVMQQIQPRILSLIDPEIGEKYYITPERLKDFKLPAYFLWTEFNPTTPWQTAENASKLVKGAWFDVMPNCGHWPQFEDPDLFHQKIRAFLKHASLSR